MNAPPEPARGARALAAPSLLAALLLYTGTVHHGVGPVFSGAADRWYSPTNFLFASEIGYALLDPTGLAFVALGLPALLLAVGVMLSTASSLAAAVAIACVVATQLFVFYGVVAPFPWQFFGWRGSAVLGLVALTMGFAIAAPLLARSWLRLGWPLRIAVYLPFAAFMIVFLRNATGTDPDLPFAISPWPAVPVFGMEVGALFVAICLIGTAIATAGIARGAGRPAAAAVAVAAGLAAPLLLLLAGGALHLFPFSVGPGLLGAVGLACAIAIALVTTVRAGRAGTLRTRARRIGVGAALLGIPLVAGQAWAWLDYYVAREMRAREIIDALSAYRERESLYPDTLDALVREGDLEEIPEPGIGFDPLYDGSFEYQSFGSSYLIEFPAPRWVQCAYTPAAVYEEYEEEEYEDVPEEELGESWSCPSRPPELW